MIDMKLAKFLKIVVLSLGLGCLAGLSACSSILQGGESKAIVEEGPVEFIDIDMFDASLTQNMRKKSSLVTVIFPNQPVTVNELPERLQRWLSAVHNHGGGISVETQEGYIKKDLLTVMGILMSGYKLAKKSMPSLMSRQYKAVIVLGSEGVVDKVDFIRL